MKPTVDITNNIIKITASNIANMWMVEVLDVANWDVATSFACMIERSGDSSLLIHELGTQCPSELGRRFLIKFPTVAAISILKKMNYV